MSFLSDLDELNEREQSKPTPPAPAQTATTTSAYGHRVLDNRATDVRAATEGIRERTLCDAALTCGSFVGGGEIVYREAYDELHAAGLACGLPEFEVTEKLTRHLERGMQEPRSAPGATVVSIKTGEPVADGAGVKESGQVRIANMLAEAYVNKLLFVYGLGWHYYDGKRWALDDIGAAKRAVLDILKQALAKSIGDRDLRKDVRKCESATGIAGVLAIASALTEFAATVRDLDADPYRVNVANGTLDLRTMTMSDHNPQDRLTKVARAAYRPDAEPGDWSQFLTAVLPDDDVRAYVQRQSGVALLGKVVEHVLPIWTGTGANGKSTAIGGLCWALGDYAMTAEPDLLLHREGAHPTGQMDLMGRRLAVITETDEGRKFAEATMKRLTGGDTIKARYMRQDFVQFEPSHTAILVTNHLPTVSGDDPAVWRRIRVVPFDVVIPEADRDPALPERLQACADEVLSWCIAGWAEYQKIGLAEPDAVLARTKDYRADSDVIGRFIADKCVTVDTVKMTTAKLFEAWQLWRATEGVPEMSVRAFGQALDRHGYPAVKGTGGTRYRSGIALGAE